MKFTIIFSIVSISITGALLLFLCSPTFDKRTSQDMSFFKQKNNFNGTLQITNDFMTNQISLAKETTQVILTTNETYRKVSMPQNNRKTSPSNHVARVLHATNEIPLDTYRPIIDRMPFGKTPLVVVTPPPKPPMTTNLTDRLIATTNFTSRFTITTNHTGRSSIRMNRPFISISLPLSWAEYHDSFRGKYVFPHALWEDLISYENIGDLINPTTIPRDEWKRFIDITFQDINSFGGKGFDREATVIDFTEDFVYVLYLLPKIESPVPGGSFRLRFKIDRKTGEILERLLSN